MKSLFYPLVATLLISALPLSPLKAEPGQGAPGGSAPGSAPADGKPKKDMAEKMKERSERMKTELGLTDEQAEKIAAINKQDMEAMKLLKDDQSLTKEARKAKAMEMRKASDEKINALLTPEQVTKREAFKKERMQKAQDNKDPQK